MLAAIAFAQDLLGEYDESIRHAVEAARVAAASGLAAEHVRAYNILVRANAGRRDLQRSISLAQEGYELAKSIDFRYLMLLLRANEAYARATLKETGPRLAALTEALRLSRSAPGLEQHEINTLINLAAYHYDTGGYAAALRHAKEAERAARRTSDPNNRAFAIANQGAAMTRMGEAEAGLALLREAVEITERTGLKLETVDLLELLADNLEFAGRPQQALQALRRRMQLDAELTRTQREAALQGLQERFSAEQKAREIERLQLQDQKREAELQARTLQQRLWAMAALALTLAALLLAQWLRQARRRVQTLARDNAALNDQNAHDPLTGTFNRRHCEQVMADRDDREPVGLLLVDVDFFKRVNDTHGHAAGDAVLVEVARRLAGLLRGQDAVVRWGGEEFLLLLHGTPAERLPAVAQRVLQAIRGAPVVLPDGRTIAVTASAGAAAWPEHPGQPWPQALERADQALYRAKAEGRDRARCADVHRADDAGAAYPLPVPARP